MTYAFTDIHGNYNLWKQIKNFLRPEDKVYFLGDACDRGKDGFKIIKELLFDSRVIYLKGNHEQLMIDAFKNLEEGDSEDFNWWISINGGNSTAESLMALEIENRNYFLNLINQLPYYAFYESEISGNKFFLSHSGYYSPNSDTKKEFFKHNCLWDRNHIKNEEDLDLNIYAVHGHTPVRSVFPLEAKLNKNKPVFYNKDSKINLDLGTSNSSKIALLNLDTFEIHYFYDEGVFKNE